MFSLRNKRMKNKIKFVGRILLRDAKVEEAGNINIRIFRDN